MFLIDSHCHLDCLDLPALGMDLEAVLAAAQAQGVGRMLCVSITLEAFPKVLALAHRYPQVLASVGVHPNERAGQDPSVEELLALADDDSIIAIGETGLDYFRSEGDLGWQQDRFRRHIEAARRTGLPLIIHSRDAFEDTLRILEEEAGCDIGGVMHCFTGDWEMAQAFLALGFYISFSGIVTFKSAQALQEAAARIPEDRLLIETDSPYLTPVPYRGKANQPAYVRHVAEQIAALRAVSLEHIAAVSSANFSRLFGIPL